VCPRTDVSLGFELSTRHAGSTKQAINTDDGDRAAKIIQDALGIESDEVANYVFPKTWPVDREQRAQHHRRVAADGGAVPGVMVHITPFFQFPLGLIISSALVFLLADPLWNSSTDGR
jgi:hypothetical protein